MTRIVFISFLALAGGWTLLASDVADYDKGLDLCRSGRFAESRIYLERFLKNGPPADLADNGYYWWAESYYAEGRFEKAANLFSVVCRRYPQGNKAPGAWLKLGYCRLKMGQIEEARRALLQARGAGAGTKVAALASEQLSELASGASEVSNGSLGTTEEVGVGKSEAYPEPAPSSAGSHEGSNGGPEETQENAAEATRSSPESAPPSVLAKPAERTAPPLPEPLPETSQAAVQSEETPKVALLVPRPDERVSPRTSDYFPTNSFLPRDLFVVGAVKLYDGRVWGYAASPKGDEVFLYKSAHINRKTHERKVGKGYLLPIVDSPPRNPVASAPPDWFSKAVTMDLFEGADKASRKSYAPDSLTYTFSKFYSRIRNVVIGRREAGERAISTGNIPCWLPDGRLLVVGYGEDGRRSLNRGLWLVELGVR